MSWFSNNQMKGWDSLEWQEQYSRLCLDTTDVLPCHIHLPVCLWIIDPHSRAPKKNISHGIRCYHKILCISKDQVTNEEVCAKIQHAIRTHEDLLTIIKRHKPKRYGHVSCSSGLVTTSCKAQSKREVDKVDRKKVGKQHQGIDGPGVCQVQKGSQEQRIMTGCEVSVMPQWPL